MFYQPELMIFLWILPVFGMVILPVLWAMTCLLYKTIERSRLADVRGFIDLSSGEPAGFDQQEKRKYLRVQIEGPKANVAKQVTCCQTGVVNVSPKGICFTNIPQQMYREADDKLKVVFRTRERDYKMLVQPRWRKLGEKGYMIGAEIIKTPAGWEDFVNGLCRHPVAAAA